MRQLFLSLALALIAAPAAPSSTEVPGWIVPVLRLVSATHVQPTTGIVISVEGWVLVPDGFAAPGDEIVVLDGGTDIVRNGRPGRLERSWPDSGLALLLVEGLHREPAPLAAADPADGDTVRLRAFPPAEQIAEGAQPLDHTARLSVPPENPIPAVSGDTPLPNVTGALLDDCGNFAGLSLASGVQSMSRDPQTGYLWAARLQAVFKDLGLPVTTAPCPSPAVETMVEEPSADETTLALQPEPETITEGEETSAAAAEPLTEPEPEEQAVEIAEESPVETGEMASQPPAEAEDTAPSRAGWWLVGALLLGGVGLGAWWRRRKARAAEASGAKPADWDSPPPPAPGPAGSEQIEQQTDAMMTLRGEFADGRPLRASAAISSAAINLVVGRSADLSLDSPSVSRRHARIDGSADALTLTDLGSSNGSSINGVPCLEGEVLYIAAGDIIVLGDARFSVEIERPQSGADV